MGKVLKAVTVFFFYVTIELVYPVRCLYSVYIAVLPLILFYIRCILIEYPQALVQRHLV